MAAAQATSRNSRPCPPSFERNPRSSGKGNSQRLAGVYPDANATQRANVTALYDVRFGDIRRSLFLLFSAVGLVLLLACANVANLFLSRAASRQREFTVRTALGATRRRLIRQLFTECLLLALIGGAFGVALAAAAMGPLLRLAPPDIPRLGEARLDYGVLLFAAGVSALAAILFGLASALQSSRFHIAASLKEVSSSVSMSSRGQQFRSALFVGEVALGVVIVAASALLLRSLFLSQQQNPGFQARHVLALDVLLPSNSYPSPQQQDAFFLQANDRLNLLPGISSASAVFCPPIVGSWGTVFTIPGRPLASKSELPTAVFNTAYPGYFKTMQIPLLAGHSFTSADGPQARPVAIVNESFARLWFLGQNAIGQHIRKGFPDSSGTLLEIVGVLGDIRQFGPDKETKLEVFLPAAQSPFNTMTVVLRTVGDPLQMAVRKNPHSDSHIRRRCDSARSCRTNCLLHTRPPRGAHRSHDRSAL
jgi:putative ABC transport system permease protein